MICRVALLLFLLGLFSGAYAVRRCFPSGNCYECYGQNGRRCFRIRKGAPATTQQPRNRHAINVLSHADGDSFEGFDNPASNAVPSTASGAPSLWARSRDRVNLPLPSNAIKIWKINPDVQMLARARGTIVLDLFEDGKLEIEKQRFNEQKLYTAWTGVVTNSDVFASSVTFVSVRSASGEWFGSITINVKADDENSGLQQRLYEMRTDADSDGYVLVRRKIILPEHEDPNDFIETPGK